jgi:thiamine pyrophosphate-dependent acetolactate synthase large subunit-like protein
VSKRAQGIGAATAAGAEAARTADHARRDAVPMAAARFMEDFAAQLPPDTIVFDEALTCSGDLTRYFTPKTPGSFFQTRGGSLGVGVPGAIGLKLANPHRPVVGFSGDGGSMYTIQALWTAAHHKIGAKFVICNNRSYKLLKLNVQQYWRDLKLAERDFPDEFDIKDPDIQFADLARSMGVPGVRVETPDQIAPALKQMFADDGPFLLDLVVDSAVPGHFVYHKCGQ